MLIGRQLDVTQIQEQLNNCESALVHWLHILDSPKKAPSQNYSQEIPETYLNRTYQHNSGRAVN